MNIFESLRVAWTTLRMHKLRSVLTMLGIIIGVGSVIALLAFGNGYANFLNAELNKLGAAVIYVIPGKQSTKIDTKLPPQLTHEDSLALQQSGAIPSIKAAASMLESQALISSRSERGNYLVSGAEPSYFRITTNDLGAGRFYTAEEEASSARVAVLGSTVAERLFGSISNANGQRITINGVNFEVIGVITTKALFTNDPRKTVYVPYHTAHDRLFRNEVSSRVDLSYILVQARSQADVKQAIAEITTFLRQRHRLTYQDNDFSMFDLGRVASFLEGISFGFTAFLGTVAGISLLVGGIGIMNIMLVSVAERTREIGLRKAVGARRRDILLQFLIEAVVLCLIGSLIGIVLGTALSPGITLLLQSITQENGMRADVTLNSILLATGVSAGIGIFFGLYPAFYASRLNPIEALRYE